MIQFLLLMAVMAYVIHDDKKRRPRGSDRKNYEKYLKTGDRNYLS